MSQRRSGTSQAARRSVTEAGTIALAKPGVFRNWRMDYWDAESAALVKHVTAIQDAGHPEKR